MVHRLWPVIRYAGAYWQQTKIFSMVELSLTFPSTIGISVATEEALNYTNSGKLFQLFNLTKLSGVIRKQVDWHLATSQLPIRSEVLWKFLRNLQRWFSYIFSEQVIAPERNSLTVYPTQFNFFMEWLTDKWVLLLYEHQLEDISCIQMGGSMVDIKISGRKVSISEALHTPSDRKNRWYS